MKTQPILLSALLLLTPGVAQAQNPYWFNINYDNLSYAEEPLAYDVGIATLTVRGLVDQSVEYDTKRERDRYNTRINNEIGLQTQLPNSVHVGARYVSNFNRLNDGVENKKYEDDLAFFVSDEIGMLAVGNVTEAVFEKTRRMRGVGNSDLDNSRFLGALDENGAFYTVRLNSYSVSLAADKEGRGEAALSYERNIGMNNVFLSGRVRKGDTSEDENVENVGSNRILTGRNGKTLGGAVVGSLTYGPYIADAELGYEMVEKDNGGDGNDHPFASVGMAYKVDALTLSAEGAVGEYDDQDLRSAALGARYDLARGLSLNLGVNYTYVGENDKTEAIGSVRYDY